MIDTNEDKAPSAGEAQKDADSVDEMEAALGSNKVRADKKKKQKKLLRNGGIASGVLLVAYFLYYMSQPYQGTMAYGICKVFIEMNVQFPTTLKYNSVEEFSTSVRVWYTHTDSFGEYILEPVQCYYKSDETLGFVLDKVTKRRREIPREQVEEFNKILPIIFANPPNLDLPRPPSHILENIGGG